MKKKNNGFTLVELLAVIVILSIIVILGAPLLINNIKDKKDDASAKVREMVITAARGYIVDNNLNAPTAVPVKDLCGYIDCPIIDPSTDNEIGGYVTVDENYNYNITGLIKLIVNYNGGTKTQDLQDEYEPWSVINLSDPTRKGYGFSHWVVVRGNSQIDGKVLKLGDEYTEIQAMWELWPSLTVKLNGGQTNQQFETSYPTREIIQLENPTRLGYVFEGWTITSGTAELSGSTLTIGEEDIVLEAKWKEDTYICAAGTYLAKNTTSCSTCRVGSYCVGGNYLYNAEVDQGIATCGPGTYSETTGNSSCATCPAGYYCTGGSNKTGCPVGTYLSSTGATGAGSCTTCAAGTYAETAGNSSCTTCPAGYYCTGGTNKTACAAGTYRNSTGGTSLSSCISCTTGSYTSSAGSTACIACGGGTTTSAVGQTSCNANCSNATGVGSWNTPTWSANSVANSCSINSCASGYTLLSGKCVGKGTATSVSIGATSGTHYCGTSTTSYKWVGEVATGMGVNTGPYGGVFKFTTPNTGVFTKASVSIGTGIFPTAGASKTFYAKISESSSYSTSTSGCASVTVKPGSAVQINNYWGIQFTINQTLLPNKTYYLHLIGTMDGNPCYFSFTVNGTQSISIGLS